MQRVYTQRLLGIYLLLGVAFGSAVLSRLTSAGSTGKGLPPVGEAPGALFGSAVLSRFTSAGFTGKGLPPVVETPGAGPPGSGPGMDCARACDATAVTESPTSNARIEVVIISFMLCQP